MINIITTQSLKNYYGDTWLSKTIGIESGSILQTIISQSNTYISGVLASKYNTSSYTSDPYIQQLTYEYAYVSLQKRRQVGYSQKVQAIEQQLNKKLAQVKSGTIELSIPFYTSSVSDAGIFFSAKPRLFGRTDTLDIEFE